MPTHINTPDFEPQAMLDVMEKLVREAFERLFFTRDVNARQFNPNDFPQFLLVTSEFARFTIGPVALPAMDESSDWPKMHYGWRVTVAEVIHPFDGGGEKRLFEQRYILDAVEALHWGITTAVRLRAEVWAAEVKEDFARQAEMVEAIAFHHQQEREIPARHLTEK